MNQDVDIRWTTQDVPHIKAASWYGLGFGQGWACAKTNLGTIWDMATKVASKRAFHRGPGPDENFIASDLGYLAIDITGRANALRDAQPPTIRELVSGYVAGANSWLNEAFQTDAVPRWCVGAAWLHPLTELDLYRMIADTVLMASGRNLVGLIGRAEAPGPNGPVAPSPMSALGSANAASNGWAFGGDATNGNGGLVMANPHFPWYGEARFFECHLTIPGEIDVYGASLIGMPGVQMGFNATVGWAHTFSKGNRFTLYRLDLDANDPTKYRFGNDVRSMNAADYSVDVANEDGVVTSVERTLWSSHHGPMVNLPLLGWSTEVGFSYRDANLSNTAMLEMFLGMDRARTVGDLKTVLATTKAMPWLNTLAADANGDAYYIDASATPNLSPAAQQRFIDRLENDPIAALLAENRVALLDGSEPDDEWIDEPGARSPGLVPHDNLPELLCRDVVVNCNDSHWLSHPAKMLEGFSVFHGFERTPRSLRTRQNLLMTQLLIGEGSVTPQKALDAVLRGVCLSALLIKDDVVARLRSHEQCQSAAEILAAWDGSVSVDARGAVLWRELLASFGAQDLRTSGALFADAFNPDNPVVTPHDLAPPFGDIDLIVAATTKALEVLSDAGVAPDARLGDVQWAQCGATRVGVPGGFEVEGAANVVAPVGALASQSLAPLPKANESFPSRGTPTGLGHGGYQITYGTSFLAAYALTPQGPVGIGTLAYGNTEDHESPQALDGAQRFAAGRFRPLCFTDAQIEADEHFRSQKIRAN